MNKKIEKLKIKQAELKLDLMYWKKYQAGSNMEKMLQKGRLDTINENLEEIQLKVELLGIRSMIEETEKRKKD